MTSDQSICTRANVETLLKDDTKVKVAVIDVDGVCRGKIMSKDKFLQIVDDGFGFCSVVFGWDIQDKMYTTKVEFGGDESKFPDLLAKVDLSSFRRIPWEKNIPFFLVYLHNPFTHEPFYCCPRSVLKSVVDNLKQLGYTALSGVEFEFFCFKETSSSIIEKGHTNLSPLTVGMCGYSLLRPNQNQEFYENAYDWLKQFNVDMESWHTETGPGVFEAAIAYQEAKESGDRAALFKTSMKQIAFQHGFMASFMAKPYQQMPGCSGHMHFSLKDIHTGKNAFAIWDEEKDKSHIPNMSITMVHFLAGVLRGLPSILAILAPTINSYKRLVENYWAPVTVSWGIENRLGAVRVIVPPTSSKNSARLEMRVSGADINPTLAMAAVLGCGYWGIHTKQSLPVEELSGDVTSSGQRLARTLQEATQAMAAKDSVARIVLGNQFVDHFTKTREHEWNLWQSAVTDYELRRYLELV